MHRRPARQLEVFDSPRSLASSWKALLQAAAVDAVGQQPVPTPGRRARRFLDRVQTADKARVDIGVEVSRSSSPYADLVSLTWRGRAVHAVATNPRHELVMA